VVLIVEGHGEVLALPILVRRIAWESSPGFSAHIDAPLRVSRSRLLRKGELERLVQLRRYQSDTVGVLLVIDADDDCPAALGPELVRRTDDPQSPVPVGIVLAKMEFEAWFLAAAESLRGQRHLRHDLSAPDNPESIRDAKGWLTQRMEGSRSYRETADQAALASLFDMDVARRSAPSFRKLSREVLRIVRYAESSS